MSTALILLVAGCQGDGTTKEKRAALSAAPGDMRRLANGGAAESAPLVFGVHGRGDTPESFSDLFHAYAGQAVFYFPRAPTAYGEGFTWFELALGMDEATLSRNVAAAADALHARVADLARGRRYVVVGFSQGGFLAYALAARFPGELVCALPVAGALPGPLRPAPGAGPLPAVFAFHGTSDPLVDIAWDRASAASFRDAGGEVVLREYPGVRHRTTPALRVALYAALDGCLARLGARPPVGP